MRLLPMGVFTLPTVLCRGFAASLGMWRSPSMGFNSGAQTVFCGLASSLRMRFWNGALKRSSVPNSRGLGSSIRNAAFLMAESPR